MIFLKQLPLLFCVYKCVYTAVHIGSVLKCVENILFVDSPHKQVWKDEISKLQKLLRDSCHGDADTKTKHPAKWENSPLSIIYPQSLTHSQKSSTQTLLVHLEGSST